MSNAPCEFIVTNEYRRFCEFADAVRRDGYIGLCYGPPGVGKTLSARRYSSWDDITDHLQRKQSPGTRWPPIQPPAALASCRTVLWSPPVAASPTRLLDELKRTCSSLMTAVHEVRRPRERARGLPSVELLIVDEADRLKTAGLEAMRDLYDRDHFGLVLIGMPGLERRLSRYPQLYSRVGFAHEYRPLAGNELKAVLTEHWQSFGLQLQRGEQFDDPEAVGAMARITGGNLRLVQRLFSQVNRIMEINDLTRVTQDVVDTAREALIIGPR
jgi:DNA transposition AAA+ family ATPase